ncbi:MAG: ribonuclease Z [Marinilabiliaceae bacterium]|nr:ribonuclease Z [Marinilabiliaceae bacterium]
MTFSLTVLGSNSALPTSERYPTAQILNVSERFFLIDCGEGVQMQLRKCRINFSKINHIYISHLHGDHCFGLIGLISTLSLLGRRGVLHIYAHEELEKIMAPQLEFFCADLSYSIQYHHLNFENKEIIYDDKRVIVESFPLSHRVPTCGFLFREKPKEPNVRKEAIFKYGLSIREIVAIKNRQPFFDEKGRQVPFDELVIEPPRPRSYAFCSDTKYFRRIIPHIEGVNVLYHEATFMHELKALAKSSGHTTAHQAAKIARDAQVGKLLMGHFSNRYKDLKPLLAEAQAVFRKSELVQDGTVYEIE